MFVVFLSVGIVAHAQTDQGTMTGTVTDILGAVVPGAKVTLTNIDTGLTLTRQTDSSGIFTFSPIKIGNYRILVSAPGFTQMKREGIHLDIQQRLQVNFALKPGATSEMVEVTSAAPLMQTEDASTGQVISAKTIDATPLNGRNWVFIAQLSAGIAPANGARGAGKGDFNANGQRAEQNNFILDGVDNNTNVVDFLNGASFVVRPPPDALAEFKVQTGAYSAEFGHSAGAVVNASIKSGTNDIHGDLWEYWRNDILDARDYFAKSVPKYRQNQFGATLGLPIFKNKLFFFGDVEANRIVFNSPSANYSVPSLLERQGNFSELLNPSLTGSAQPIHLYQPGSADPAQPLVCNGQENVFCPNQINAVAQHILNLYPLPNSGNGALFNNYAFQRKVTDNTFQWDTRLDWIISHKDQAFARFSYLNERSFYPSPLGPILDGGGYGSDGDIKNFGNNFALSETHDFSDSLINEFRFGYNYGHFSDTQPGANIDTASQVGLGGIPFAPLNGGLPATSISGISSFGAPQYYAANEYENVFQILDNVTKVINNHTLKAGLSFQHIRSYVLAPTAPRGAYNFNGKYTGLPGKSFTGSGVADFLANSQSSSSLSSLAGVDQERWNNGFYFQDDWKALPNLTFNLGLRYEFVQPFLERHDRQASFYPTSTLGPGSGSGVFVLPKSQSGFQLPQGFLNLLAKDNVQVAYDNDRRLVTAQHTNFAPRIGVSYRLNDRTVVRAGYGIFFGGNESTGGAPNLGFNFPFQFTSTFLSGDCSINNCPTNGITLENGFSSQIAEGLVNSVASPTIVGSQRHEKTPY
ncbi:MAG TPA: TonB-dependent receptor, partial [Edaphobacter sp.]|nr:TonB-dependent receptor [Edaphobacter sp.]